MDTRAEFIRQAKPAHDRKCSCEGAKLLNCSHMAQAILDLAKRDTDDYSDLRIPA